VIGGAGTFEYLENDPAISIGTGITVAGGTSYAGQYVQFGISGSSPWEVLHLPTDALPVITNGVVSIVGVDVFLGNGTTAEQIGEVDASLDGTAGKVLRVNFSSTFQNPGFETADMSSWTALNQRIDLGVTSIAGCPTVDTNTYPGNDSGQDNRVPTIMGSYTTAVDSTYHSAGAYSLRLLSTGIQTASGWDVVHGPAVYSSTFDANAGDVIDFDWQARSGSDAEDVFGYIIDTTTCAQTVVLDHTGNSTTGSTSWATVSTVIPATGTYRFVFVSGTYDLSGGRAAGASLYIDNMRVYGTKASDAVVQQIANRLTYANSSYDLPAARTIVLSAKSAGGETASANITVNIEPQDEAPVYLDDTIGVFHFNQSYSDAVTTRAWPLATYTLTGATPTGITFDPVAATFTGTPTVAEEPYDFTITADNRVPGDTPRHYSGTVQTAPTSFTDSDTGVFVLDRVHTNAIAANGFPVPSYAVTSGSLPAGITLDSSTGAFAGTPTQGLAPYNFTITATNLEGSLGYVFSGTVETEPTLYTDSDIGQFVVGTPHNNGVHADGLQTATYAVTSGILPPGLILNSTTGVITGTPTTTGPYGFWITASNAHGSISLHLTGVVASTPAFTDSTLALFTTGHVYSDGVSATGYPAATFSVTTGTLPAGLTLNLTTGVLTGTPTGVEAPYSFTISATNVGGSVSVPYTGTVRTEPRSFTDGTLPQFITGTAIFDGVTANGFPAPTYSITTGLLPTPLALDSTTGAVTGTPSATGPYSFTITATNSEGTLAKVFSGLVASTPAFIDSTLANFRTGLVYTDSVSASGYPAATFTVSSGVLPAGVFLDATTGAVTGTPTGIEAPYTFSITATNLGGSVSVPYTGTVRTKPLSFTDGTFAQLILNLSVTDGVTANGFPAPTYSISAGLLPTGVLLNSTTGAITGTPTFGGPYTFTILATNSEGTLALPFSGGVAYAPAFVDGVVANFTTDHLYADAVSANGYPVPVYSVSAGTLPAGLTLNSTTGALTGTPTGVETPYSFILTATNPRGAANVAFTGTVRTEPRNFTDGDFLELVVGSGVTYGVTATGFPAPTFAITSGSLPAGLTLDLTTGTITGTPTVAGLYRFGITATNSEGTLAKTFGGRVFAEDRGYLGLNPGRLFDSRDTNTPVAGGSVTEISVLGRFGVPGDARAAVLNITITEASASGYATVYPCGTERPLASNLNFVKGDTVSNAVTSVLGTDGKVCVFVTAGAHLVIDVNGAFSPTQGVGQLLPLAPSRLFDSRDTNTLLAAGSVTEFEVTGHGGVPANAGAVVLNLTVTGPIDAGYITVFPCGSERPLASNINFVAGETVPKAVTAAIGDHGRVCVFTSAATHLVVDINGAFSLDGLGRLQGLAPHRLLDTRDGAKPAAGAVHVLTIGGQGSIPANTMAVVLNVTVTDSDAAGFATVYPCEAGLPLASNVNFVKGETAPNAVTASLDSAGQVCLYVSAGAHVVVDINGIYIP
jgi:hypothetical protein